MRFRRTIGTAVAATTLAVAGVVTTAGPASAAHVVCGAVITTNTTLHSDVGPCPGNGLTVTAGNITLNLNGHRVFAANGEGDHAGIILRKVKNVNVRNGTVEGFDAGVLIAQGSDNSVATLTLRDNVNDGLSGACNLGDGIAIRSSDNNRIVNNRLFHNGPYGGISLITDSDSNLIKSNQVEDSNIVGGVGCGNPFQNEGIRVEGPGANHNRVEGNTVLRGLLAGIGIHGNVGCQNPPPGSPPPGSPNTDNFIVNNKVRLTAGDAAADGIAVLEQGPLGSIVCAAFRNTFTGNASTDNQGSGIYIGSTSVDNVISSNFVNDNGVDGIYLGGPFAIDLFENVGPTLFDVTSPDLPPYVENTDFRVMSGSGSGDVTAEVVPIDLSIPNNDPINSNPIDTSTSGCEQADYAAAGFQPGDIALIQRGTCTFVTKVNLAVANGASAIIMFNEGQAGRTSPNFGGVGAQAIPVLSASYAVGVQLQNGATAHVVTNTTNEEFPVSGAENNTLYNNRGSGNGEHDGHDVNPSCDNNDWVANKFGTVNRICVTANGGTGVVT